MEPDVFKNSSSQDKGFLDHRADMDITGKKIIAAININTNIMKEMRQDTFKTRLKLTSSHLNPIQKQKLASKLAEKYLKHYSRMEKNINNFKEISNLQLESTKGFFTWHTSNSEQEKEEIRSYCALYSLIIEGTQNNINNYEELLTSNVNLKGVSKDLNIALDRGIYVIGEYIEVLRDTETKWSEIIDIINRKLN